MQSLQNPQPKTITAVIATMSKSAVIEEKKKNNNRETLLSSGGAADALLSVWLSQNNRRQCGVYCFSPALKSAIYFCIMHERQDGGPNSPPETNKLHNEPYQCHAGRRGGCKHKETKKKKTREEETDGPQIFSCGSSGAARRNHHSGRLRRSRQRWSEHGSLCRRFHGAQR